MNDGTWVDVIVFADNYWLVATSTTMLKGMAKEWLNLLTEHGWETPTEGLPQIHIDKKKRGEPRRRRASRSS